MYIAIAHTSDADHMTMEYYSIYGQGRDAINKNIT